MDDRDLTFAEFLDFFILCLLLPLHVGVCGGAWWWAAAADGPTQELALFAARFVSVCVGVLAVGWLLARLLVQRRQLRELRAWNDRLVQQNQQLRQGAAADYDYIQQLLRERAVAEAEVVRLRQQLAAVEEEEAKTQQWLLDNAE